MGNGGFSGENSYGPAIRYCRGRCFISPIGLFLAILPCLWQTLRFGQEVKQPILVFFSRKGMLTFIKSEIIISTRTLR